MSAAQAQTRGSKIMPCCPECGSKKAWKDGLRYVQGNPIQRFLCRSCGYRFSETSLNVSKDPECNQNVHRMALNMPSSLLSNRQICALETERVKNLVKVEPQQKAAQRESNIKGQLISFAWHLKKMGRSDSTIKTYLDYLEILAKDADLLNPEEIKLAIANKLKSRNTKCLVCYAYDSFLKFSGITWEKPQYKQEHKRAFIPTEDELKLAINCGRKASYVFTLLVYETGARVNEAERLEWTDLDHERNKVTIRASKNGNARVLTISKHLTQQLLSLPRKQKTVFPKLTKKVRQTCFRNRLRKLARLHDNPRLTKIHYHTFRHCKALREYHKTKSMQHVKRVLGHKSIMTTQRYVDLYEEIYSDLKPDNMSVRWHQHLKMQRNSLSKALSMYAKSKENSYSRKSNEKTPKL